MASSPSLSFRLILKVLCLCVRSKSSLAIENLALRQQLAIYKRQNKKVRLVKQDRTFWIFLRQAWPRWKEFLVIVKPETVLRWHYNRTRSRWNVMSKSNRVGRKAVSQRIVSIIEQLANENPLWGAPRIHGEMRKLGIKISERSVSRLLPKDRNPWRRQSWMTFLRNHRQHIISIDFFTTFTPSFKQIFGFVMMEHGRRKIIYTAATHKPTRDWVIQQFRNAFPGECSYKFAIMDNDSVFRDPFAEAISDDFGLTVVKTTRHRPWQNGATERLIQSIQKECLDHVVVLNVLHLHDLLVRYADYYNRYRTHLTMEKDSPAGRPTVVDIGGRRPQREPVLGGLHGVYSWNETA